MNLYEWGCSIPWCITDEALSAMLAIAAREDFTSDDLKVVMHGPKSLALRDGQRREDSVAMQMLDGVARIAIDGPIYRYADYFTKYSGGVTTEALAKDIQKALDDPAVGAIALIIDSPGGEATGINELADMVYQARGRKPIGAYIEGYGASAAYWIASAADVVTVDESALVGSIGTVMGVPDPTKRPKYTIDFVSSQSPKKRVDPTAEDGRAYLQSLVDDMTEVFIAKVMRNRGMSREQVLAVEGGMRIGAAAVAAGLADRIGAEDTLIRELATRAARRAPFTTPPARVPGGSPLRLEETMNWKAFWGGLFESAAEAGADPVAESIKAATEGKPTTTTTTAAAPAAAAPPTTDPALAAEVEQLRRQLAEQREQQVLTAATTFADSAIRAGQAYPAERDLLIRAYVSAAQDDARAPWPQAAEGEAATRVALLEAQISARPPHTLTQEQIAVGPGGKLEQGGGEKPISAERKQSLLALTPMGQAALKRDK